MALEKRILIVDDEPHIREVIQFALQKAGFETMEAKNGEEALEIFHAKPSDLIILDVLMPEKDGIDVCRLIRQESNVPILFLSSRAEEIDRILGLEMGGDDYISKPFSPRELVARIKAVFRRINSKKEQPEKNEAIVIHGRLKLDNDRYLAYWDDSEISLTPIEFGLLRTLIGYPGKVFTRDELMDGAYTLDTIVTDRTIDSHIRRVRKKFSKVGHDPIETVHGLGYKLGACH